MSSVACIFPRYLVKGTIFEKKVIEYKMCFNFLYNIGLKYSHSKKNGERCEHKCS